MRRITIFCLFLSTTLYAQETTYGIRNNVFRHEMNPAFVSDRDYISMPLISGSASYYGSTLPLKMLLNGQGTPGDVTGKERLNLSLDDNIISGGWHHGRNRGIFSTVSLSVQAAASYYIPQDLLRLTRDYDRFSDIDINNAEPFAYDLSGANLSLSTAVRLSFGQSYRIMDNLRIGYKVNASLLPGYADVRYDTFRLDYNGDRLSSSINGSCLLGGLQLPVENGSIQAKTPVSYRFQPGCELSFDLGAVYQPLDWVEVSASVSSLGFRNANITQSGSRTSEYVVSKSDITYENYLQVYDSVKAELGDLFSMPVTDNGKSVVATPLVARAGAVVSLPMLRMISFSFLYRFANAAPVRSHDARWGVQLNPAKWVDIALSYAYGTSGHQMGAMLLFKGERVNFMMATDSIPFRNKYQTFSARVGLSFYLNNKIQK